MSGAAPTGRPARSPLAVVFLTVFIDLMGFGIVIPLLPIYAERMHATPFAAASLVGVYSLMQLAFAPFWGALSDRIGRRPVLLVSLAGSTMSYLLLGAASTVTALFVARILAGVAGANIPVAQAYIADVTSEAERARGMGLIGAAFGLGMVVGPAMGGALSLLGPRVPELSAAALCGANVLLAAFRLPESLGARRRTRAFVHPLAPTALRGVLGASGAPTLFGVFFLVTLGFAVLEGTFSLAAKDVFGYAASRVDALWVYMGLVAAVVQGGLVGRLARRMSEGVLVAAGCASLGLGLLWVPLASGLPRLLAALALVVSGQGLASPALASLLSKTNTRGHGEVLGLSQSLASGARVLGPACGGFVYDRLCPSAPYVGAAVAALVGLALVLPLARRAETAVGRAAAPADAAR